MIDKEDAIKNIGKAYPPYLSIFRESIASYISDNGEILWHSAISNPLVKVVCSKFSVGDYKFSEELFLEIEHLILNGNQEVRNIISTGFLEGMQNQTTLLSKYWAPLAGEQATEFCKATDEFYGLKTEGLPCYKT